MLSTIVTSMFIFKRIFVRNVAFRFPLSLRWQNLQHRNCGTWFWHFEKNRVENSFIFFIAVLINFSSLLSFSNLTFTVSIYLFGFISLIFPFCGLSYGVNNQFICTLYNFPSFSSPWQKFTPFSVTPKEISRTIILTFLSSQSLF